MDTFLWILSTALLWLLLVSSIILLALIGLAATILRPAVACPDELVLTLAEGDRERLTNLHKIRAVRCLLVWVLASQTSIAILRERVRRSVRRLWLVAAGGAVLGVCGYLLTAGRAHALGLDATLAAGWLQVALGAAVAVEAMVLAWVLSALGGASLDKIETAMEFLVEAAQRRLSAGAPPAGHGPTSTSTVATLAGLVVISLAAFATPLSAGAAAPATQPASAAAEQAEALTLQVDRFGGCRLGDEPAVLSLADVQARLVAWRAAHPQGQLTVVWERRPLDRDRRRVRDLLAAAQLDPDNLRVVEPEAAPAPASQPWVAAAGLLDRPPVTASQPDLVTSPAAPVGQFVQAVQAWMHRVAAAATSPTTAPTTAPAP